MDLDYEIKYHKLEEEYWWFVSRRNMVMKTIKSLRLPKDAAILDIGCSGGKLITMLKAEGFYNITGIDVSESAIELCKQRDIDNVSVRDGAETSFAPESFDLIVASDVLEHIQDDAKALAHWNSLLKEHGRTVIFVPAFKFLWSYHDVVNHHFRRYTKRTLVTALQNANFEIKRKSYWNLLTFVPIYLVRLFSNEEKDAAKAQEGHQLYEINPSLNKIIIGLFQVENALLQCLSFPIGVSVFSIAAKKSKA